MPFLEHAEPKEDRLENLHEWVIMAELFTKIGITKIPGECGAGRQKAVDLTGSGLALRETETMINTDNRSDNDAVGRQETLTR